ncbi:MAG: pyruvate, phosphate dikinase [Alphaproteobacteria bacterium]
MNKKWVYNFSINQSDGNVSMKELLGGKGANLAEMCSLGINVPPGCTIISDACNYYLKNSESFPEDLIFQVKAAISLIEKEINAKFGDTSNPLLLSVRSGSRSSMPGMMDTILNLGLNDETVEALSKKTGNERFAYDSYRRFIQIYSDVVLGIDHYHFEEMIELKKQELGIHLDTDLTAVHLKELVVLFKDKVLKTLKKQFPNDLEEQLWNAIGAVFKSWMNSRAVTYRNINNIPEEWGTAVNIQAMVFGNMGNNSATGVAFTRNPSNGDKLFFGEFLINAQGEDVVAGIRTPQFITKAAKDANASPLPSMEEIMPDLYNELYLTANKLEKHYCDMQDIEFTIEEGKLWILQTRSGKRTTQAAIKIAVDMVEEGQISEEQALIRIDPLAIDQLLHPSIDPNSGYKAICKGLPASPGAASGIVVFNSDDAEIKVASYQKVILVRIETSPEDIHGMYISEGVLTSRGGMTSHAAVVARGMGKPCVCGASNLNINYNKKVLSIGNIIIKEGDLITINGSTGEIILGEVPTIQPKLSEEFQKLMNWANNVKKLQIRANAETPLDTMAAKRFGAEGIGLCRTEHMFFNEKRINVVRQMIISSNKKDRGAALAQLLPMQQQDFVEIFKIMNGLPVNLRLLDPPLHEFLPHTQADIEGLAEISGLSIETVNHRINQLKEANPMLGHRGCRLGISYPEIYKMQAEAIFLAMVEAIKQNVNPIVEIMVPLIISGKELEILKTLIEKVGIEISEKENLPLNFNIGTMIELPRAALQAEEIAKFASFFSFGTNDLTQTTLGISRDDSASFMRTYKEQNIMKSDPFIELDKEGVGELIKIAIERGRKTNPNIKTGICGEHGGNPFSIEFFDLIGLDYVSCSPYRVPIARLAAAQAVIKNSKKSF